MYELARLAPRLPIDHASSADVRPSTPLTPAERRALFAVAHHASIGAAAESLYLSRETVKGYLKHVYRKLGVSRRDEAIRVASAAGLLDASPDDGEADASD